MNILNEIVRGASNQFGREFGRAGANQILKGANSYTIEQKHYDGRKSVNDSSIVRAIKDIKKTEFVSTNKANVVRLIDITNDTLENIRFDGINSIAQLDDISYLLETYNEKFELGSHLIDDDYHDKSVNYLEEKRKELLAEIESFNTNARHYISVKKNELLLKKKKKNIATILSIPVIGGFGIHRFYLGKIGQGIVYLLFSWTFIPAVISLIECISFLSMSEEKFDQQFNPEYSFFKRFI